MKIADRVSSMKIISSKKNADALLVSVAFYAVAL